MAGFLFASLSPAHADDDRDDGLSPGRPQRDHGAGYALRDERGRRTGSLEEAPGGYLVQRDNAGRRVGTIKPGFGGEMVVRDTRGRRVGTINAQ